MTRNRASYKNTPEIAREGKHFTTLLKFNFRGFLHTLQDLLINPQVQTKMYAVVTL